MQETERVSLKEAGERPRKIRLQDEFAAVFLCTRVRKENSSFAAIRECELNEYELRKREVRATWALSEISRRKSGS